MGLISRSRHRRGFGIHSPFAFDFITTTLKSPRGCDYYAYEHIEACYRQLYRVLVRLHPSTIVMIGCDQKLYDVVHAGCPSANVLSSDNELTEAYRNKTTSCLTIIGNLESATETCQYEGNMIILPPYTADIDRIWHNILATAPYGMSFESRKIRVFVADSRLPRQDYSL